MVLFGGAVPARSPADELPPPTPPAVAQSPAAATLVQLAAVTEAVAQLAAASEIVAPPPDPAVVAPLIGPPPPKPPVPARAARRAAADQVASVDDGDPRTGRRHLADTGDGEQKIVQVKAVGPRQVGDAAWYGGRYVGRRTSSGERLDRVHATAAHRSLPLNSLARVTNLDNGRSVVVKITDRGPVSEDLLIDMSPKAADALAMKQAGIVRVAVEQVVEVPAASK
jgi:rare lipoprotein A